MTVDRRDAAHLRLPQLMDTGAPARRRLSELNLDDPAYAPMAYSTQLLRAQPRFAIEALRLRADALTAPLPLWSAQVFVAYRAARRLIAIYGEGTDETDLPDSEIEILVRSTVVALAWRCQKSVLVFEPQRLRQLWIDAAGSGDSDGSAADAGEADTNDGATSPAPTISAIGPRGFWIPLGPGFTESGYDGAHGDDFIDGLLVALDERPGAQPAAFDLNIIVLNHSRHRMRSVHVAVLPLGGDAPMARTIGLALFAGGSALVETLRMQTYRRILAVLRAAVPAVVALPPTTEPVLIHDGGVLRAEFPTTYQWITVNAGGADLADPRAA